MSIFLIFDFFFVSKVIKERLRTNFCCKFLFRDVITKKTAVLLHFVQIASPLPPNLDNLYNFFSNAKNGYINGIQNGKGLGLFASLGHIVRFAGNLAQLFRHIP